jgi:hypothetical protein
MRTFRQGLFVALLTALAPFQFAVEQAADKGETATRQAEGASPLKAASLEVPKGEAAWAMRLIRTGGLAGRALDVSITSAGEVKCVPADNNCPSISQTDLQALAALVDPKLLRNSKSSLSDGCRDCAVSRITVAQRDPKGKVQTYFAYFDDVTAAKAPFQMVRIALSVGTLGK